MPDAVWLFLAAIAPSLIVTGLGATWVYRRQTSQLLTAQANRETAQAVNEDAETHEITDRIARQWISDLRAEVGRLSTRLDREIRNRHALNSHVGVLEAHIAAGKPPPPPPRPVLDF